MTISAQFTQTPILVCTDVTTVLPCQACALLFSKQIRVKKTGTPVHI